MGLRPEHLTVSADVGGRRLAGTVRRIEDLGADTLIGVQPDPALGPKMWELNQDDLIWIRQTGQARLMAGDPCTIALEARMASYFDSEAGANLASSDQVSAAGLLAPNCSTPTATGIPSSGSMLRSRDSWRNP